MTDERDTKQAIAQIEKAERRIMASSKHIRAAKPQRALLSNVEAEGHLVQARALLGAGEPPVGLPEPPPVFPMRADFLKVGIDGSDPQGPDYQHSSDEIRDGFRFTTLQYANLLPNERETMRKVALQRGHTHLALYVRSNNDIKIGNFDYYGKADDFRDLLIELVDDGLGPIVFLLDDEGKEFNRNVQKVIDLWERDIPQWGDLCSVIVPGLELDEYYDEPTMARMFRECRAAAGEGAYIAGHFRGDKYFRYPEMDGILWQFATWNHDENGKDTEPRRQAHPNFVSEIKQTDKAVSREWASPMRQAHADGIDFIAGEWTQLFWDSEEWAIEQGDRIAVAIKEVNKELGIPKHHIGLMNGLSKP